MYKHLCDGGIFMFMGVERAKRKGEGRWYLAGPALGLLTMAALLAIFALALQRGWVPEKLMEPSVLLSVFLGSVAGGARASAVRGEGVLTCGAAVGCIHLALLALSAWLAPEGRVLSGEMLRLGICCLGGGALGGVLLLRRGKTHKRR